MSCLETFASLRIFSQSLHPDEIGRALGIQATDPRPMEPDSKYRPRREYHYWDWCSKSSVESTDGIEHVRAVLQILQGKEQQLSQLREAGCAIDVCCYWVSSGQGGPFLDVPALTTLAHLGLEIWWDVYFGKDEDYAEGAIGESAGGA